MKIELQRITVREALSGYKDNAEEGVVAYGGKLQIRPKYQREFVYTGKQRESVIETVIKDFPLNVMYWVKIGNGNYEVLDGQQRTISIGQYVNNDFSINEKFYHNLTDEEQEQIQNYELMVYFCEGTDREKLNWFKIINIAGEKLTEQELLNAVYTGPWLSDAKLKFSKTNCIAYKLANDGGQLVSGSPIRQEYLETVISWINNDRIADYMAQHQHDANASELLDYFKAVIEWVRRTFTNYRKEMKTVGWGALYNKYKNIKRKPEEIEKEIVKLINDDEVQNIKGIYTYILTREQRHLNLRQFDDKTKRKAYERQKGICVWCKKKFEIEEMEADHITPWHEGGKTDAANCQMLCKDDNRKKSGK